jgi:hypothetical protein
MNGINCHSGQSSRSPRQLCQQLTPNTNMKLEDVLLPTHAKPSRYAITLQPDLESLSCEYVEGAKSRTRKR